MTPEAILVQVEALGVQVQLTLDSRHPLDLVPAERTPDELRPEIVANRAAMARPVRMDSVAWRVAAVRPQLPKFPLPTPLLVARPEVPYQRDHRISCSDPAPATRWVPCRVAVARVLGDRQVRHGLAGWRQTGIVEDP